MTTITNLFCEYRANPLGIDVRKQPRLSWQLQSDRRGAVQTAYQVRAAEGLAALASGAVLWDSGQVASEQSIHVPYAGAALRSCQRVYWQVRAWDETGVASAWSAPAFWEMGLLDAADWQAEWITPDWDEDTSQSQPQPVLRRAFKLDAAVKSARVFVTCD